jgi:hypothetical protein
VIVADAGGYPEHNTAPVDAIVDIARAPQEPPSRSPARRVSCAAGMTRCIDSHA